MRHQIFYDWVAQVSVPWQPPAKVCLDLLLTVESCQTLLLAFLSPFLVGFRGLIVYESFARYGEVQVQGHAPGYQSLPRCQA